MQQVFKKSEPTGLSLGSKVALVEGDSGSVYTVLGPGVSGRTSWEGLRLWDAGDETGSWQATVGQQGPRSGKVGLSKGTGNGKQVVQADFTLEWEPVFYVQRRAETRTRGTRTTEGKSAVLVWVMNLRRVITLDGVRYDRVVDTWTFKKPLPFKS